ncbi:cytochrome P450 [Rhodocollybia butyracea]|uniref:Cytochrome P450 n=1 Tax=Rhodocollybia butyracea TaxID=206335 RepID=A0A9P5TXS4_9AGAR|nr:cytochrome P450 [Rhodocollybia butyracea]
MTTSIFVVLVGLVSKFLLSRGSLEKYIPMPGGASFIWGHQKYVFESSAGSAYTTWFRTLNSHVLQIRGALGKPNILIIADPLAINHIMIRRIYQYREHLFCSLVIPFAPFLIDNVLQEHSEVSRPRIERLLGRSLGWVEGENEHKRMSQLVVHSFSWESVRSGAHNIYMAANTMLQKSNGCVTLDITKIMQQATLDAIGRYAFAHDFGGGRSDEANCILNSWRSMAEVAISLSGFYVGFTKEHVLMRTKDMQGLMLIRRVPILNRLPLRVIQSQGNVRRTIHAGIARELLIRNKDLLAQMSDEDVPEDLLFKLSKCIAGSETTAQALSYAIWELAKNPPVQDRLRAEVKTISPTFSFDQVQGSMPFLDAVTREILRLHPPTPYMERNAIEDDIIPLKYPLVDQGGKVHSEIRIHAGQTIVIPIHSVNRLTTSWGDGDVFRPDRWLEKDSLPLNEIVAGGWSSILTFSDGPRICTGYRLAIFEFKLFLAMIIDGFQFIDTGLKISDRYASTMNPVVVGEEKRGPQLPVTITLVD